MFLIIFLQLAADNQFPLPTSYFLVFRDFLAHLLHRKHQKYFLAFTTDSKIQTKIQVYMNIFRYINIFVSFCLTFFGAGDIFL